MLATQAFTSSNAGGTLSTAVDLHWHIGDVITKLRKRRRGMTQTVLAKKAGVNKATIVRAEAGDAKVSRATYINIAKVLGTDLAALEVEAARLARQDLVDDTRGDARRRPPDPHAEAAAHARETATTQKGGRRHDRQT